MAYLEDKIQQVQDKALRDVLLAEVKKLKKEKRFGLVFEDHVPELVPVYSAPIRPRSTVALKDGDLQETFRVNRIKNGTAFLSKDADNSECDYPLAKLVVVQRFGEAIYPALIPMATVENGGERPFHTLIEADNYHALQLLDYLYAGQVDCIYIDPPYNTGAKDWKYNNNYVDVNDSWRHSKWLAMMKKRLGIAKNLLREDGVLIIAIDDHELAHLLCLVEDQMPNFEITIVTVVHNPRGNITKNFARTHEYAVYLTPRGEATIGRVMNENTSPRKLRRWGHNSTREARRSMFYPIYVKNGRVSRIGITPPDDFHPQEINKIIDDEIEVWPIDQHGVERRWNFGIDTIEEHLERIIVLPKGENIDLFLSSELSPPKTVWLSPELDAGGIYGSSLVESVINNKFPYPKSLYAVTRAIDPVIKNRQSALVVDFFAGSGTTLNAVNLLNATDNGNRRCILVTNNEVSAEEAKALQEQGLMPGDAEYEKHGICQSVTYLRSKYTILGKRDDGTLLDGDYLTGRTIAKDKRRTFKQIGFIDTAQLTTTARKKELAGLLDGIPQSKITKDTAYFVDETCTASVLFDDTCVDAYLDALDDMTHIETFYLVTANNALFKRLKDSINEMLGLLQVSEDEKRPLSAGFEANLAYFKLDFLDADEVQLGRKFAALLPILWLMAGAKGVCPQADDSTSFFIPECCPFGVLLDEHCFLSFKLALQARPDITHVFLVTNSKEGFFAMRDELDSGLQVVQLYKNYLDQFKINTEQRGRT